jgi:DNA-binding NarL/FixJ family response regulator
MRSDKKSTPPKPPIKGAVPSAPLRILVVDDHPIVREGIRRKVEQQPNMVVCCEAGNTRDAIACIKGSPCDIAIIDISLTGPNGIDLIKQIRARKLTFPILVLSIHDDVTYVERALAAGAQGYLVKHQAPHLVIEAMYRILAGEIYVCEPLAARLLSRIGERQRRTSVERPLASLSDREVEVFEAIGRGKSTRQIAESLFLSISTIETYKSRIKTKLGLKSASELAACAARWPKIEGVS